MKNLKNNEPSISTIHLVVPPENTGQRLDLFLVQNIQQRDITRSRIRGLIQEGYVLVNGKVCKAGYALRLSDTISVSFPAPKPVGLMAERVFFQVLFEDDDLLVLSKPPGTVVHPACGHDKGTLVHGLLHHCGDLSEISGELRPGIVHRLDKDTSGVMVVAKNDRVHHSLAEQFKGRSIQKIYHTIIVGKLAPLEGSVDLPIGRHPVNRKKMTVRENGGREALSHWKVIEVFEEGFTYVEIRLETGRTHQIRVHMAAIGHPVAGDLLYGRKKQSFEKYGIERQCLHAYMLAFAHPVTREKLTFTAPVWPDMQQTIDLLRGGSN